MLPPPRNRLFGLPPGVGDVDHHPVGARPFHLEIAVADGRHLHIQPGFLLEPLTPRALQLLRGLVEVFDLKAEMMDAAEVRPVDADVGRFFRFLIQDRQIDLAVGQ
jgi:hypothetical protein